MTDPRAKAYANLLRDLAGKIDAGLVVVTTFDIEQPLRELPSSGWAEFEPDGRMSYRVRVKVVR